RAIDDLHVSRVHAPWKAWVSLDQRALRRHRRRIKIIDDLHGVRIAHRQYGNLDDLTVDVEGLANRALAADERNLFRRKSRRPHVDDDLAIGCEPGNDDPGRSLDANCPLRRATVVADKDDEEPSAVHAFLDITTDRV